MKKLRANTSPKNFRLSKTTITILARVAKSRNMNQTEVIEHCVGRFAHLLAIDSDNAALLIQQMVAKGASEAFRMALMDPTRVVGVEPNSRPKGEEGQ